MLNFLVGNDLLSAIVAFALVLIPAVIVHELGHLLAAKAVGITVLEFGIGFPPRLAKLFKWGETEFTLNWIPIGGFVRPLGEDMIRPLSEEAVAREREQLKIEMESAQDDDGSGAKVPQPGITADSDRQTLKILEGRRLMSVNEAKPLPRILFMSSGAIANFMAAFALFIFIALMGLPEVVGGRVWLLQVYADSAYAKAGLQAGDFVEELNHQKFTDSQDFIARLKQLGGETVTLTVLRPENPDPFEVTLTVPPEITDSTRQGFVRVLGIAPDSPGERAGLQPNDLITAFNNQSIANETDPTATLQALTAQHAGEEVILKVIRGEENLELPLIPRVDPPEGEGRIGIAIASEFHDTINGLVYTEGPQQQMMVSQPLGESIQYGFERTWQAMSLVLEVPVRLVRGTISPEEARPVSIVGISQYGGAILQQSIEENRPITILNFIAVINILLGITNLLPIPALDGGRILFVLLEIVRGRPIAPEREGLVHLIGLAFLLALGMLVILNDLINPITNIVP